MKKIIGSLRKTIETLDLIQEGDRVAVGLSGGKDSTILLYALARYRTYSKVNFHLEAITIALGFQEYDLSPMIELCQSLDVPYTIEKTEISKIVFDIRQ